MTNQADKSVWFHLNVQCLCISLSLLQRKHRD